MWPPTVSSEDTPDTTILSTYCKTEGTPSGEQFFGSLLTVRYALAVLGNDLVDQTVLLGLLRRHDEIALDVFFDFFDRLAAVVAPAAC